MLMQQGNAQKSAVQGLLACWILRCHCTCKPLLLGLCHRSTEIGPRALVLVLLPTAVAATMGHSGIADVLGALAQPLCGCCLNKYRKRSGTVTAPAGKLGLLFDEFTTPPTVTGLAALSSLHGKVKVGWKLEKVDDVDVSKMTGAAATQLLEERAANARRLEFDRTLPPLPNYNHGF